MDESLVDDLVAAAVSMSDKDESRAAVVIAALARHPRPTLARCQKLVAAAMPLKKPAMQARALAGLITGLQALARSTDAARVLGEHSPAMVEKLRRATPHWNRGRQPDHPLRLTLKGGLSR